MPTYNYVKCPICGNVSVNECGGLFCNEHIYRHPNCSEGK